MVARGLVSSAILAVVCVACVGSKDDAEKKALEKRVAELESQLKASPTPTAAIAATPEAAPTPTAPTPAVAPARKTAPPVTSRPRTSAARPKPAPASPADVEAAPAPDAGPVMPTADAEPPSAPQVAREVAPPTPEHWSIPDGAQLDLVMETPLSTKTSVIGDAVVARIESVSDADGPLPLPGGSIIEGRVTRVKGAGRVGSKALLGVVFDRLTVRGLRQPLEPVTVVVEGASDLKRDGAMVAGGAVAGAIVGGIIGGKDGAKKGAAIGTVGGAGAAAATKADQVEIAAGEHWSVTVTRSGTVERP